MRSIYFHIGYPRSGSTFIQKNYFSSKEKNINFISREFNHGKEDYFFYLILDKIVTLSQKKFLKNLKEICHDFKKIKFDKKKINIISEELVLCQNVWKNNNVYRTLERLIVIFKKCSFNPKFIVIIRNQEDLMISYYKYFFSSYFYKKKINFSSMIKKKEYLRQFDFLNLANFFKKKKIKYKLFLFEDLIINEIKFRKNLFKYLGTKKNYKNFLKDKSFLILNSNSNYLHKYYISINFWFRSQKKKNFTNFIGFIKKILCRIMIDKKIENFKISVKQKKIIYNFYYKRNLKLNNLIDLNKIYLKNNDVD